MNQIDHDPKTIEHIPNEKRPPKWIWKAGFGLFFGAWASQVNAGNPQNVFNNMAHEMAECSAYFYVVSTALHNSKKTELAQKYEQVAENAVSKALILTEAAGLMPETVSARVDTALQEMIKKIGANTSNISILSNQYNDLCEIVMNDSEARAKYWVSK